MCLGIPAKVIELYETNGMKMAKVDFGGVIKEACMEYLPEVKLGDYTIVHVGFGLSILDEQEALETMELLKQIDALGEEGISRVKYLDEYRDADLTRKLLADMQKTVTRPWTLMEVCGGQTHSIIQSGLDQMLPPEINLIHGPGCPVCVTPLELVDKAIALASRPDVIFTSYGDMLRVPGSERDLFAVKAAGGDVRIVYSPLDALKIARDNPSKTVVFFAIGFETTAPANAMAVLQARAQNLANFAVLVSHVTVPAAITALMDSPDVQVDGFLAAGHVCTVMGYWEYEPLAEKYKIPIVVTGFEPVDIAPRDPGLRPGVGSRPAHGPERLCPLGDAVTETNPPRPSSRKSSR